MSVLEDQKEKLNLSLNQMLAEKNDMDVEVNVLTKKIISLTKELADCKSEVSARLLNLCMFAFY